MTLWYRQQINNTLLAICLLDDDLKPVMHLLCCILEIYLRFSIAKDMFHYQLTCWKEYKVEYAISKKVHLKLQKVFRLGYGYTYLVAYT